jgi:hypothetical protein
LGEPKNPNPQAKDPLGPSTDVSVAECPRILLLSGAMPRSLTVAECPRILLRVVA